MYILMGGTLHLLPGALLYILLLQPRGSQGYRPAPLLS